MTVSVKDQDTAITSSRKLFLITPHATDPLAQPTWKGIHVGATEGNIAGYLYDDPDTLITLPVAARTHYTYVFKRIIASGTTATTLHGCY